MFEKVFGSYSSREIKRIDPIIDKIEALEEDMKKLSDNELKAKTEEFKSRLKSGETLDDILPETFAVVREAADRVLGTRHYRVQLIGGVILHQGRIAEMKTGEGKTLVATLALYLNALEGKGAHLVTVNDYLASYQGELMGRVYKFLGLSVGILIHGVSNEERKLAYEADITYGTNNEFGFDYLRDNMVIYKEEMVQKKLNYSVVDEVDSILIDEARTPLIISGTGDKTTELYFVADRFVSTIEGKITDPTEKKKEMFDREYKEEDTDYIIDEKDRTVTLTDRGITKAEKFFSLENFGDIKNMEISHHINQSLRARNLMRRDSDYVVKEGQIIIVDQFTGRLMFGRSYSDGLHQAIEAKEGLEIRRESKTMATITYQNFFRMYTKLAGMTGTAKTEEDEFREIYGVDVVEIPTNEPVIREDHSDVVYKNIEGKYKAVINDIEEKYKKGQPVLVGTISIEKSEMISSFLKKKGIVHEVLNAKRHEREAEIVAQAGRYGVVTIATNMAGRGTDIILGGNAEFMAKSEMRGKGYSHEVLTQVDSFADTHDPEVIEAKKVYKDILLKSKEKTKIENKKVLEAGGVHIIGTERHESRRIDNQLRGRSGRQGDPGSSKFFLSLEDDLMRLFATDGVRMIVDKMGMPDDEPLEHGLLTRTIENAQKKVEGRNFNIRKHVLQYDDVMNKQREIIYDERKKVLEGADLRDHVFSMLDSIVDEAVAMFTAGGRYPEEWNLQGLEEYLSKIFMPNKSLQIDDLESLTKESLKSIIIDIAKKTYDQKEAELTSERLREIERVIVLRAVDSKWIDHIDAMAQLKQGIGLRAMGQEDPVRAYQGEGFDMFQEMIRNIQEDTVRYLFNFKFEKNVERKRVAKITGTNQGEQESKPQTVVKSKKVGRNEPCPCGSGKKYKKCCGDK